MTTDNHDSELLRTFNELVNTHGADSDKVRAFKQTHHGNAMLVDQMEATLILREGHRLMARQTG